MSVIITNSKQYLILSYSIVVVIVCMLTGLLVLFTDEREKREMEIEWEKEMKYITSNRIRSFKRISNEDNGLKIVYKPSELNSKASFSFGKSIRANLLLKTWVPFKVYFTKHRKYLKFLRRTQQIAKNKKTFSTNNYNKNSIFELFD